MEHIATSAGETVHSDASDLGGDRAPVNKASSLCTSDRARVRPAAVPFDWRPTGSGVKVSSQQGTIQGRRHMTGRRLEWPLRVAAGVPVSVGLPIGWTLARPVSTVETGSGRVVRLHSLLDGIASYEDDVAVADVPESVP
ncbi:MAG TPA: hypothetical protein VI357_09345 [Mycobacteriales bacterium]